MTTLFKSILFKVLTLASILLVAFSSISTNAQYGGGTSIGVSTGSIQVNISNSESQSTLTIVNGKKGDVVNLTIPNSGFGVLSIRFTLGADANNAVVVLKKSNLSDIFPGLDSNKKPVVLYSISLSGISYEQILNFNFKFRLSGISSRSSFEGFSSNSPWVSASLSSSVISSNETEFSASTPIAFKQYAVSAQEISSNPSTTSNSTNSSSATVLSNTNSGEVKGASDKKDTDSTSSTKKSSDDIELIRTGQSGQSNILGALIAALSFALVSFLLYKSNKKA